LQSGRSPSPKGSPRGGRIGISNSLVTFLDFDPELQQKLRGLDSDMEDVKKDLQAVRYMLAHQKEAKVEKIEDQVKKVREEVKDSLKEMLAYIQEFQNEFETERNKKD